MKRGKIYIVQGKEVELFTIGELARRLEREQQTIRKWEKAGVIPPTRIRSKTGRRLYTEGQINALVKLVDKYNIRQGAAIPKEFIKEANEAFMEHGII